MIERNAASILSDLARSYPVVTVTGPRQSGKTTLCRAVFSTKPYVSLEPLDVRRYAVEDPRGFLAEYAEGAVVDEVQHAPDLLSYIQPDVDERPTPGRFVLTGSQHLGLTSAVAQTLAGRTGLLFLLPPSLDELRRFSGFPETLFDTLWAGAYPRIHDRRLAADRWLADYAATYLQRDVRQLLNVGDLTAFDGFLRLCAGRTAQVLNLSSLGADAGVSHNTARAWLSVLEASFICFRVPAWHRNIKKQVVKTPKLHFVDSGLACHLLGIRTPEQLRHHPLRGAVFESWVVAEVHKAWLHAGRQPRLFHYRDAKKLEVDLLCDAGNSLILAEAKSGATVPAGFVAPMERARQLLAAAGDWQRTELRLVFGGDLQQRRSDVTVVPWNRVHEHDWGHRQGD